MTSSPASSQACVTDAHTHTFETFSTKRAVSPALEAMLYEQIPVLDHGFIRIIDYMGNDHAITQAARVSYGTGTKRISQDRGLIRYLLRHRHTSPFEMCEIKLHLKMPIFVARQWLRHRTANVNEYSARYSILDKEFYLPAHDQVASQSTSNNQGRAEVMEGIHAKRVLDYIKEDSLRSYAHYQDMLNIDDDGQVLEEGRPTLARELARTNLPVNFYTQMYWKIDLHNFMHFLSLRADAHAQYEIRVYAEKMLDILKAWVPITCEAFSDYRTKAISLSNEGTQIIQRALAGETVTRETTSLSVREWDELVAQFPALARA